METGVLCYLVRFSSHLNRHLICLALKKKKMGAGFWNGYGGHCENNEDFTDAAIRETREESGVLGIQKENLIEVAHITYFERPQSIQFRELTGYEPKWSVREFVIRRGWVTDPTETKEMGQPRWFEFDEIPYKEMLPADRFILPLILALGGTNGRSFEADVYYGPEKKEVEWVAIRPF